MNEHAYATAEHHRLISNLIRFCHVSEVDGGARRVRVQLDADWVSDWLPWFDTRSGSHLRTFAAPSVGEGGLLLSPSGEPGVGMFLPGAPSDEVPAPSADAAVTVQGRWEDGALDQYDANARERTITVPAGGKITVQIAGGASVLLDGNVATIKAGSVLLGPDGDRKPVARVGDMVLVTFGSSAGQHPIQSGSPSVRAS